MPASRAVQLAVATPECQICKQCPAHLRPYDRMIDKVEIDATAKDLNVHASNVQRDYVFGWLLAALYGGSALGEDLILKGGNCFRKAYFPLGRFSSDLDFSCRRRLDPEALRAGLNGIAEHARDVAGITFDLDRTLVKDGVVVDAERTAVKARLYFRDFYGAQNEILISVRLDITEFDRMHLEVAERPLIHNYSDAALCAATVRCWQLEEMLAAKLKCLVQRQHLVDLYDLVHSVFINRDIEVNRAQVASVFLRKTIFGRSPGAAKALLLQLPLAFAKASWDKYIVCPAKSLLDFDSAEQQLRDLVEAMFAGHSIHHGVQAFYPPAMRTKIMDAGREKRLMRMQYGGSSRIVEPYALSYKVRKDGVGQEYFYAFDRTGGSSGPALKTFLQSKITSLDLLDDNFEPQFEIELSKSGEYPSQVTFADPNRILKTRRPRKRRQPIRGPSYTLKCPLCGKRFRRNRPTTRLNPHKNSWGSRCPGRTGYLTG